MRRGTTPSNIFTVDTDLTSAEALYITYRQGYKTVVEKSLTDGIEVTAETITVTLSQADTLKFAKGDVEMQIRARFPGGEAIASQIMTAPVEAILKDGVI